MSLMKKLMTRKSPEITRKTNEVSTLKGFTVPPGYTLRITKDDGTVEEKRAGEQSGSHYSFEDVRQGIDPDWELTQDNTNIQYMPLVSQVEPPKPKLEYPDEFSMFYPRIDDEAKANESLQLFDALVDMRDDQLEKIYDFDTVETLAGLTREMRKLLFTSLGGDVDKIKRIDKDYIMNHPRLQDKGGYKNLETINREVINHAISTLDRFTLLPRAVTDVGLSSHFLIIWEHKLSTQAKERLFGNDVDEYLSYMRHQVGGSLKDERISYPDNIDTSFEKRKFYGDPSLVWKQYLPSFFSSGEIKSTELKRLLDDLKNPDDAQRILVNAPRLDYYSTVEEREQKMEEFLTNGTVGNQKHDALIEIDFELDEIEANIAKVHNYPSQVGAQILLDLNLNELESRRLQLRKKRRDITQVIPRAVRELILREGREKIEYIHDMYTTNTVSVDKKNEIENALSFVRGFVHPDNMVSQYRDLVHFNYEDSTRASYASPQDHGVHSPTVNADKVDTVDVLVHELGHHIERTSPIALHIAKFLARRIKPTDKPVKLKDIVPDSGYGDDEVCFEDEFKSKYIGKLYTTGISPDKPFEVMALFSTSHTEVVSMGLQYMYQNPCNLARVDPDWFKMVWGLRNPLKTYLLARKDS